MSNRPAIVKQAELTRYFKAWKAAGFSEPRAEIKTDGTVILLPMTNNPDDTKNDWD